MSKTNPQRKMSRLKLKKLKEDAKYNDQMRIERNSYLLETEWLKRDIKELEDTIRFLERENQDRTKRKQVTNEFGDDDWATPQ